MSLACKKSLKEAYLRVSYDFHNVYYIQLVVFLNLYSQILQ